MEFQIRVTGRGLATAVSGIAAAGMIGYLWLTAPERKIEYKSANAPVSQRYERGQTSSTARSEPMMVVYDMGIHSSIAELRREEGKAKRSRKTEFAANMSADEVPQQIVADLQCDNKMEKMQAQMTNLNGSDIVKAYCPEWVGGSGTFYFNMYRMSQADFSGGDSTANTNALNAAEEEITNLRLWSQPGAWRGDNAIQRLRQIYSDHSMKSSSAMSALTPDEQKSIERFKSLIRNHVNEWENRYKLYEIEKLQLMKSRVSNGKWQKIYTGGNFAASDEIVNGMPVLYEDTDIFLGEGSQAERRKSMLVKNVFNGEKYEAAIHMIERSDLAERVRYIEQSGLPDRQKESQFLEMQKLVGPDLMTDAFSYMEGIDAVSAQQLQTYLNATGAYAQQAQLKTPTGIALFFAGRVIHHATADSRYKNETIELSGNFPRLAQWIRDNGEIPNPDTRSQLMRDNWSANYETPAKPFRANDLIGTRRSSDSYGSYERGVIAPGATESQARELRQGYAVQQDRQRIENNRQDFYNSPVGRMAGDAENAARSFGGAAINAGRQAAPQVQQQIEGAARQGAQQLGNIFQNLTKPPEKKNN